MPETKLPKWLADIEARCEDDTNTSFDQAMRRLADCLELAKAQHEALSDADRDTDKFNRARRLWEGQS